VPWSYGSWIYNYLCNQCLSPLMLWVWISIRARCTTLCDKVCQWLATGLWFSPDTPISSTNKTERHDVTEILFNMALNTIKQTNKHSNIVSYFILFSMNMPMQQWGQMQMPPGQQFNGQQQGMMGYQMPQGTCVQLS
jgi:hypothetical protein